MGKRYGLSRAERITRKRQFDRVFQEGTRRGGPLIAVRCIPNGLSTSRLGIALGRGWRGTVARNQAKRLVREAFRTHKHELPEGMDIVVVPRTNWDPPRVESLAAELCRLASPPEEEPR
ncbi:MAG: ribonuclease P protein component [Candidatus Brocadiia bacterium]